MKKKKKTTAKKKATKKKSPASKRSRSHKSQVSKRAARSTPTPKSSTKEGLDRLELAKLIGVHPDTVSDYTRAGMPVITRGGAGRKSVYDAVACLKWWRENQGQDKKEVAQTRAYTAQAELNELKLSIQKGELLPRDEVVLAGQSYTKAWTAKLRAMPRQMVQRGIIATELEPAVTALIHDVLSEISRWETVPEVENAR